MVSLDESLKESWANVETQYQRRANLIPNLVETVKGYANFEKETLTEVIEARAKATSIQVSGDDLTPENLQKFQKAQNQLSGALSRLLVTIEKYPDLKANQNFMDLQNQLEGTENRIAQEIRNFNASVREYNTYVRSFPQMLYAGMFGFKSKPAYEAEDGSEKAPEVSFE